MFFSEELRYQRLGLHLVPEMKPPAKLVRIADDCTRGHPVRQKERRQIDCRQNLLGTAIWEIVNLPHEWPTRMTLPLPSVGAWLNRADGNCRSLVLADT